MTNRWPAIDWPLGPNTGWPKLEAKPEPNPEPRPEWDPQLNPKGLGPSTVCRSRAAQGVARYGVLMFFIFVGAFSKGAYFFLDKLN